MSKQAIELLRPHRHAGRDYQPGQVLRLPVHKADWLVAKGVAKDAAKAPPAPVQAGAPLDKPAAPAKAK